MSEDGTVWGEKPTAEHEVSGKDLEDKFYDVCNLLEDVLIEDLSEVDMKVIETDGRLEATIFVAIHTSNEFYEEKALMLGTYAKALKEELKRVEDARKQYDKKASRSE